MNWLKLKLRDWVNSAQDTYIQEEQWGSKPRAVNSLSTRDINSEPTLNFKVYSAVGGKIVEFSRYDRKNDRSDHQIYIIGKDEDFGEKIAKISTLEVLR
jgi:hypothetical protein